jgi:hypothetical protein
MDEAFLATKIISWKSDHDWAQGDTHTTAEKGHQQFSVNI